MQTDPGQIDGLRAFQKLVERDLLTVVFENAPSQVFVIDAKTLECVAANAIARTRLGLKMRELSKMNAQDLIPGIEMHRIERLLHAIQRRKSQRATFTIRASSSPDVRLEICLIYNDSTLTSLLVFVGDVSSPYRAAAQANDTMHIAIDALPDGFVLYDADDKLVVCNQRYKELYHLSAPVIRPGASFKEILEYGMKRGQYAEAIGREDSWLAERLAAHQSADTEVEQALSNGRWLQIVERKTSDGGRVGLRVDITKIKQQQQTLDHLTRTDDLTGLLNRRGLLDSLTSLSKTISAGQRLVIFQIDLDRFKAINEFRGHAAGDQMLIHCAELIAKGPLRAISAARIGADEFVMVLRTKRKDASLQQAALRLIELLSEPIFIGGQAASVGASVGIAKLRPERPDPITDMMTGADIALNQVKQTGGNDALLFHDSMREEKQRNHNMAEQIHLGLARREFTPYFQPQIDTETGDVIGFEALIRWLHPVEGLVPAFQFLEVAQRSGLTETLDNVVMDKSCEAARQLLDWGMENPCISINMSVAQISDTTIVDRLEYYMKKHCISSKNLRVELLESTLLDKRAGQIVRNVHHLIDAGFPVELDDFGTGHAAIATLRKFTVSCIKIDRSLVQNIDQDGELQVITAAIIDLANRLGIAVLAEGVETQTEQRTLSKMGCHRAQGYFHARPMPLQNLRPYLQERNVLA